MRNCRATLTVLAMALAMSTLGACSSAPDDWRHSVERASDRTALHLTCIGNGIADVTVGTLEGGLEGAAVGLTVSAEVVNGQLNNEAVWLFIGSGAALGSAIGVGAGFSGEVIQAPATYTACLRTRGIDFDTSPTETPQI